MVAAFMGEISIYISIIFYILQFTLYILGILALIKYLKYR